MAASAFSALALFLFISFTPETSSQFIESGFKCHVGYSDLLKDGRCLQVSKEYHREPLGRQCPEGEHFLSIHSSTENEHVLRMLNETQRNLWLGLTCAEFGLEWDDYRPVDWTNFERDPNPCNSSSFYMDRRSGKWHSGSSHHRMVYICVATRVSYFAHTIADPPYAERPCGDFERVGNSSLCVKLSTDPRGTNDSTWRDAERKCAEQNAHLVSIHDDEVNRYVLNMAARLRLLNGVHIGLLANRSSGREEWTDGSAVRYKNHSTGFPNEVFGACTAMRTFGDLAGSWLSIDCDYSTLPFVCSRPALKWNGTVAPASCPDRPYYMGSGELFSPSYPVGSELTLSCEYLLVAMQGSKVEIVFEDINTKGTVTLFDGAQGNNIIVTLRGSVPNDGQRRFRTKATNVMRMVWQTSGSSIRGWHARFSTVYPWDRPDWH